MSHKLGRNDPCPCGSTKKYKKCCMKTLPASSTSEVVDLAWRKLRQLEGSVFDQHLIPYAVQELPKEVIDLAWWDSQLEDLPDTLAKEVLFDNFFLPWFLFNWFPFEDFGLMSFDPEITLAQNYVKAHESKLNSHERRFIEAMNQTYYSFYSVLEVERDRSLLVKDILLGTLHTLKERQGTHYLKRGNIVFGRILTLDNQSIFVGMAPYIVPADYHHQLINFKQWLVKENENRALTADYLHDDVDEVVLDCFLKIITLAYDRPLPTLLNTDGELIQFCKSHFNLTLTPEEALSRLLPLTLSSDPEEFLQDAKRNKADDIKKIEFPWLKKGNKKHKSWNNTVMGHITVKPGKLILETNSHKRTQRGKQLLNKYLGETISFQQTLIETPVQKLNSLPTSNNNHSSNQNLPQLPEVQEQLKAMVNAHWESWFDEPIPALNNQTPREAATTEDGRERLEALLLTYDRHNAEKDNNLLKANVSYLRAKLNLDK